MELKEVYFDAKRKKSMQMKDLHKLYGGGLVLWPGG